MNSDELYLIFEFFELLLTKFGNLDTYASDNFHEQRVRFGNVATVREVSNMKMHSKKPDDNVTMFLGSHARKK